MAYTAQPQQPDDLLQRIATIRRHLIGLTKAVDEIEREMLALHAPQTVDGERAAVAARLVTYQQGPREVKIIRD